MICNETYYGGYRTRSFADIYPNVGIFETEYLQASIPAKFSNSSTIKTLYYLLYSRYGNSHIAFSDENQFKYSVLSIIFMYGPTWEKRLLLQDELRALTADEIQIGSTAIYNHAFNPSQAPSTQTLEELTFINEQNTTKYKKSKLEGISTLMALLDTDVTEEFISKFKRLFITITAPDYPLLYEIPELEDLT